MTYDQAQSPRLGQRTPVESTYVQIVDVTPGNTIGDLIEAAWPGMLVFRNDLSELQIYDPYHDPPGWRSIAGGVAGQLTYVGPTMPTTGPFTIGDVWYDSDDAMKAYVWDGDSWEVSTSAGGIQTYYANGWGPQEPPDPEFPDVPPPPAPWVPLVGTFNIGDIWYQTDDGNHPYRWNGSAWIDVKDANIQVVQENARANTDNITNLTTQVIELGILATSADNTADTADGRVSMSDYNPGTDDVLYDQTKLDPATGETIITQVPRQNGSIWFTRTRPRRNLCTNPSVETNLDGWSSDSDTTFERMAHTYVPAGLWVIHVYSGSLTQEHWMSWGESARLLCVPEQIYTASIFGEMVSGLGVGLTLQILWYDAVSGGSLIGTSVGEPLDLAIDAFTPGVGGTMAEPRLKVTGTAPAGAVAFAVREVSPAGNAGDQWHTGALVIEQEDDLGRYFDGDSYDGHWDGAPHASTSYLTGDKIVALWELRDESWVRKYFDTAPPDADTTYGLDASRLTGTLDGALLGDNTIPPQKLDATRVLTSEALGYGDLVNIWNNGGLFYARRASAVLRFEAHGFVLAPVTSGALATVYHVGYDPWVAYLSPGAAWLGSAGRPTSQPPSAVGSLVQRVGFAPQSGMLNFSPDQPIRIT